MAAAVAIVEEAVRAVTQERVHSCKVEVKYASEEIARLVMDVLCVDAELQPDKVKREILVDGPRLVVSFASTEPRFLRASFSAFMDILTLASRTLEEFSGKIL